MFDYLSSNIADIHRIIRQGAEAGLSDSEFILREINHFKASRCRKEMLDGERYFRGDHDILKRKRTVIGREGKLEVVNNLPNNRIIDNQYRKVVNQKDNYLLGQPITFQTDNKQYAKALKRIMNKRFLRMMKNIGRDALNCGIGWVFVNYDDLGELSFQRMKPYEIIPLWQDAEHTVLDAAIRFYNVVKYEGKEEKLLEKVEVYDKSGIYRFVNNGVLKPDEEPYTPYFTLADQSGEVTPYHWNRIPLVPFKANGDEIPLIRSVKSLQDGLNMILSTFQNNMEEDARNTILVIVNAEGEDLEDFRHNLATYGVVKVRTEDGVAGDVRTLQVEVNSENYKAILEIFKKAIYENAMAFDAKDDRLSGNPNQMNIQSMYSDIDLDANEMETEFQAAFEELLFFANAHLYNVGAGDFEGEDVEIIFNRDMLMNEKEIIENVNNSIDLSEETRLANHPWVDDVQKELQRKRKEEQERQNQANAYDDTFRRNPAEDGEDIER